MNDELFQRFYNAGMRKMKPKQTRILFNRLLKKSKDPEAFTTKLIEDVQNRLRIKQFGFDKLHPTTYLNGERWDDEVISNEETIGHTPSGRPSVVDRVKQVNAEREQARQAEEREINGLAMAEAPRDLWAPTQQSVRGDDAGELGEIIDGHCTRSD